MNTSTLWRMLYYGHRDTSDYMWWVRDEGVKAPYSEECKGAAYVSHLILEAIEEGRDQDEDEVY